MNESLNLYTIGCSTLSFDFFLNLLLSNKIDAVADVRSVPFSKYTPQFNAEQLRALLKKHNIYYLPFAQEFGARRIENEVYTEGRVDFEKVKELPIFIQGIDRIKKGLEDGYKIALMCTEKNPADCHRFSLVSRGIFEKTGISSKHILTSGKVKTTETIELELIKAYDLEKSLFDENTDIVNKLYKKLEQRVAYKLDNDEKETLYA